MEDAWFIARRIGRLVARDPARGMRRQDVIGEIGVREWLEGWGLAYARGLIDFCGDFVVAPAARRAPSKPVPKQEARTTCAQVSARDSLFLQAHRTRTEGNRTMDYYPSGLAAAVTMAAEYDAQWQRESTAAHWTPALADGAPPVSPYTRELSIWKTVYHRGLYVQVNITRKTGSKHTDYQLRGAFFTRPVTTLRGGMAWYGPRVASIQTMTWLNS